MLQRVFSIIKEKGLVFFFRKIINRIVKNKYPLWLFFHNRPVKAGKEAPEIYIVKYGEQIPEDCKAQYVGFLADGAALSEIGIDLVRKTLVESKADFIYGDNDKTEKGKYVKPFFKPDFSPHTLENLWYTQGFEVVDRKKWGNRQYSRENILEFGKNAKCVHIPHIITHNSKDIPQYDIAYNESPEFVSIIILGKDNPQIAERCINSIKLDIPYEIIFVDNGSSEENRKKYSEILKDYTYIYEKREFNFSYMCNLGAKNSKGDVLVFLNDDTEVKDTQAIKKMAAFALRDNAGAVGCKLLYPEGNIIQHCGVAIFDIGPVHLLQYSSDDKDLYYGRNRLVYNTSAVTAACMAVERKKFYEVGGFDEELPVAYNDTALCLKLYKKGYYNVNMGNVSVIHYESLSRGNDLADSKKLERLARERKIFFSKFPEYKGRDPFYNVNLGMERPDFDIWI